MAASGVDCVALRNGDHHDVCFDLHNEDGRIILTSGHAYELVSPSLVFLTPHIFKPPLKHRLQM